jgi:SSS family solute:Na+ symporter
MQLHFVDVAIVLGYFVVVLALGFWVSRRKATNLDSYFLGGKSLPWYVLGISDASGMFDISGTMWLVYILFVYGLKSVWLPFVWPVFNQIFLMVYLSGWLRRSNVLTGAEWVQTRFGRGTGANLAHIAVVCFALINVVGMLAYAFKGIGKFAVVMLPWHPGLRASGPFGDENAYAIIILGLTSLYVIKGGMVSVVITEVMQFAILTVTSIVIGGIAMAEVSPAMVERATPRGWDNPFFGWRLELDWAPILGKANDAIREDGNQLFMLVFGMMMFKGVLASLAGPAPNYDMQRILATRNPREACLMNGLVNVVLYFPRYMMITGITVLALVFCMPELRAMEKPDFEKLLPIVLARHVPIGVLGFLLAGLLAAFMSNFAATVNAAPAYIVNDIYKRFLAPNASGERQVALSRAASLAVLAVGIAFGLVTTRITDILMWIVGALYGGYIMANVLKWYWWRFNGYGYFWGMVFGIGGAMVVPPAVSKFAAQPVNMLFIFPVIFALSTVACVAGTLLTPPEDDATLCAFYKTVRPWGAWRPIREKVLAADPGFVPNASMNRDVSNVVVGIVWQLCLVVFPIYLVLQRWPQVAMAAALLAATTGYLKCNWYDRLQKGTQEPGR